MKNWSINGSAIGVCWGRVAILFNVSSLLIVTYVLFVFRCLTGWICCLLGTFCPPSWFCLLGTFPPSWFWILGKFCCLLWFILRLRLLLWLMFPESRVLSTPVLLVKRAKTIMGLVYLGSKGNFFYGGKDRRINK